MRVGFTGTRWGMTDKQKNVLRATLVAKGATVLHHGDCIGADAQCHTIATELGIHTIAHPPTNNALRAHCEADEILEPKPYLVRNADIVAACDYLIAAPHEYKEQLRGSGTWTTIRMSRAVALLHGIIYPGAERVVTPGAETLTAKGGTVTGHAILDHSNIEEIERRL